MRFFDKWPKTTKDDPFCMVKTNYEISMIFTWATLGIWYTVYLEPLQYSFYGVKNLTKLSAGASLFHSPLSLNFISTQGYDSYSLWYKLYCSQWYFYSVQSASTEIRHLFRPEIRRSLHPLLKIQTFYSWFLAIYIYLNENSVMKFSYTFLMYFHFLVLAAVIMINKEQGYAKWVVLW